MLMVSLMRTRLPNAGLNDKLFPLDPDTDAPYLVVVYDGKIPAMSPIISATPFWAWDKLTTYVNDLVTNSKPGDFHIRVCELKFRTL